MNRYKQLREAAGLSQKEVAIVLGLAAPSISNWESGKTAPSHKHLARLAELYNVSIDALLGQDSGPEPPQQSSVVRIPVLGVIPAGIPFEAVEDILDWEEIPERWTHGNQTYFALKVTGNSMFPEYRNGDVIILRKSESAESGQDCAVSIDGSDATFKRFKRIDGGIMFLALNPEYQSYIFTEAEAIRRRVNIYGVVVELRRKF